MHWLSPFSGRVVPTEVNQLNGKWELFAPKCTYGRGLKIPIIHGWYASTTVKLEQTWEHSQLQAGGRSLTYLFANYVFLILMRYSLYTPDLKFTL